MTKKEVQERFEKGEVKVFGMKSEGIGIAIKLVEIDYDIDDRIIGFVEFGDGEKKWFRRKLYYNDEGATFKVGGHSYNTNEFIRV